LPGRIAIARNHPEADAVNLMGWVGFSGVRSYVELLTCLQIAKDIKSLPKE
jgi:hypothetical protein